MSLGPEHPLPLNHKSGWTHHTGMPPRRCNFEQENTFDLMNALVAFMDSYAS